MHVETNYEQKQCRGEPYVRPPDKNMHERPKK